jgi:rubrerythrin
MRATIGAGKGGLPREGQYSKKTQAAFARGYARACGSDCLTCKRRGYIYDDNAEKQVCPICKGAGIAKGK